MAATLDQGWAAAVRLVCDPVCESAQVTFSLVRSTRNKAVESRRWSGKQTRFSSRSATPKAASSNRTAKISGLSPASTTGCTSTQRARKPASVSKERDPTTTWLTSPATGFRMGAQSARYWHDYCESRAPIGDPSSAHAADREARDCRKSCVRITGMMPTGVRQVSARVRRSCSHPSSRASWVGVPNIGSFPGGGRNPTASMTSQFVSGLRRVDAP